VAVREFKLAKGHGRVDYLLFVDGKAIGVVEAKKAGFTLTRVEVQAQKYSDGLLTELEAPYNPLPFCYLSTGVETRFTNYLDPKPRSRRVFQLHRPGSAIAECHRSIYSLWRQVPEYFDGELKALIDDLNGALAA
jgi:type I restriction enzyme R subunit